MLGKGAAGLNGRLRITDLVYVAQAFRPASDHQTVSDGVLDDFRTVFDA